MRAGARLRVGRVLAIGLGVWFRRFLQLHAVTALCLAPLAIVPRSRNPAEDGTIAGLFGLYPSAWMAAADMRWREGLLRNATVSYLAQFAVTVILVRDAHRRLAGRPGGGPRAMVGLVPFALGSLAVFVLLDLLATGALPDSSPLPAFLGIAATLAEILLAATFWLAIPAAAVDGHGPLAALGRSRSLARGSRLAVGSLVVMLAVLEWILLLLPAFVTSVRTSAGWVFVAPAILCLTLKACVLAAAYRELCLLKEGPRPEEVSAIFA